MTLFKRTAIVVLALLLFPVAVLAQSRSTITLKLKDASTGEAVSFATVTLTKTGETKHSKYVLSGEDGSVKIEGVAAGNYTLKAELLGYKAFVKQLSVEKGKNQDLGAQEMDVDRQMLDAASITAAGVIPNCWA